MTPHEAIELAAFFIVVILACEGLIRWGAGRR
jgi:hypothetical protein